MGVVPIFSRAERVRENDGTTPARPTRLSQIRQDAEKVRRRLWEQLLFLNDLGYPPAKTLEFQRAAEFTRVDRRSIYK